MSDPPVLAASEAHMSGALQDIEAGKMLAMFRYELDLLIHTQAHDKMVNLSWHKSST